MSTPTEILDDEPQQVDLSLANAIIALGDAGENEVTVQVLFRDNPPDTSLASTWVAEFVLVNWPGIVQAAARGKAMSGGEANAREPEPGVAAPQGLKLISPNGGFVE